MRSSKKIVFFVASFSSIEATAPLGILAISTPLLEAGYEICIIDASISPDYKKRIMEEIKDALCLGISLVTGPMIRETVEVAKAIKKWDPDFPVILGGWHPSLLPTQTLEAPYVDIVVRAQGEESMLAVADRLRDDGETVWANRITFLAIDCAFRSGKRLYSRSGWLLGSPRSAERSVSESLCQREGL